MARLLEPQREVVETPQHVLQGISIANQIFQEHTPAQLEELLAAFKKQLKKNIKKRVEEYESLLNDLENTG